MNVSVVGPNGEIDGILALDPDEGPQLPVPKDSALDMLCAPGCGKE